MAPSFTGPAQSGVRQLVPLSSTFLLLIVSFMQLPLPYASALMPPLGLMGIYYWSIYRPDRFGILAAFLIGLLQDLVTGAPLGITAFLYAAAQRLLQRQQGLFRGAAFALLWGGYLALQLIVSLGQWLCWSALAGTAYPLSPFILQLALAICLFPPIGWGLGRLHAAFISSR